MSRGAVDALPPLESRLKATLGRRWWLELTTGVQARRLQNAAIWDGLGLPDGEGRRVVLVPGYMAGHTSMGLVAEWLIRGGYDVTFAPVGRNAWASSLAVDAIVGEVERRGTGVTLIGHSRGGQQARVAAGRAGHAVDHLVTLGSPVRYHRPPFLPIRTGIAVAHLADRLGFGPDVPAGAEERYEQELLHRELPNDVRWTSIWTRRDGIVQWKACVAAAAENVEVDCTHLGLTGSISSFEAVAVALA